MYPRGGFTLNRRIIKLCAIISLITGLLFYSFPLLAQPSYEEIENIQDLPLETQQILEQSLSITEIDRQIQYIEQERQQTEQTITKLSGELDIKQAQIVKSRERAGNRLRAYYVGQSDDMLVALLSTNNLRDFLVVLDYFNLILENDRDILSGYTKEYQSLRKTKEKLVHLSTELTELQNNLVSQRARVAALNSSVNNSLSASNDPEKLRLLIKELSNYWDNVGLYEVRRHFKALASAMQDFPEFLTNNSKSLEVKGSSYTLTIKEEDLNAFLRSKNALFDNFKFSFDEGKIIAEGSRDQLRLQVEGHYSVENEPDNTIRFHVDKLVFNGLELPDTTRQELEQDFDLGFYPKKIISFVEATEVYTTRGVLTVKLKLSL